MPEPDMRMREAFLADVARGVAPYDAARIQQTTLSAFRRLARSSDLFAEQFAEAQAERNAKVNGYVETRLVENVERAMQVEKVRDAEGDEPAVYSYQGAVANRSLELLGKTAGMFGQEGKVEHTHHGLVEIVHERRLTLADVREFERGLDVEHRPSDGLVVGDGAELPGAREVLAAPE
jgi:hypothetical protein